MTVTKREKGEGGKMRVVEFLDIVNSVSCGITGVGIADLIVGITIQIRLIAEVLQLHGMVLVSFGFPIIVITTIAERLFKKEKEG